MRALVDSEGFWIALAGAAVVGVGVWWLESMRGLRQLRPWAAGLSTATGVLVSGGHEGLADRAVLLVAGVALMHWLVRQQWGSSSAGAQPIMLSVLATGAVYACVPDTERALVVLGAVVAAGLVALVGRLPWASAAPLVTGSLLGVAVTDGWARPSAVIGAGGVAVLYVISSLRIISWASWSLAGVAMWISSRAAGLGPGTARPVMIATACVVAVTGALARPSRRRPVEHIEPPLRDD